MKKSRFTESQIIRILSEQDQGKSVSEICRTHQISQPTFCNWKGKYSGMSVSQLKKMKEMESDLNAFKKMYAATASLQLVVLNQETQFSVVHLHLHNRVHSTKGILLVLQPDLMLLDYYECSPLSDPQLHC